MPVLVPVDLTLSRSFRKPICSGTLMEGTSLSYVLNSSKVFVGCGLMGGRSDEFKVQPQKKFGKKNNCRESVTTQDNRVLRPRSLARSLASDAKNQNPPTKHFATKHKKQNHERNFRLWQQSGVREKTGKREMKTSGKKCTRSFDTSFSTWLIMVG